MTVTSPSPALRNLRAWIELTHDMAEGLEHSLFVLPSPAAAGMTTEQKRQVQRAATKVRELCSEILETFPHVSARTVG